MLPLRYRLKKRKTFNYLHQHGKRQSGAYVVVYFCSANRLKVGFSASKKVGNSVVRHRITRLIRESYRLNEAKLLQGYDIVVVARANAKGKNYFDICRAFLHLAKLHRIIEEK